MPAPVLSIAVVNYNSAYRLENCLDAIARHPPSCPYEVVVVDNASTDDSAAFLRAHPRQDVRLIESPINLLYTAGINLAFRQTRGTYFMILAPDMVAHPGSFDALVRHMDEDDSLGAIGGYTLDRNGDFQRYLSGFPTPFQVFIANYFSESAKASRLLKPFQYDMRDADFSQPLEVPAPSGGCLIVRRVVLQNPPMGDEFGLFWSDLELFRRIWDAGTRIMIFPDAPFVHDHNDEPRRIHDERSLLLVLDYLTGCARYYRKYGSRTKAMQVKTLFSLGAIASLTIKHVPRWILRKESLSMLRARVRLLRDFVAGRNVLLDEVRSAAAASTEAVVAQGFLSLPAHAARSRAVRETQRRPDNRPMLLELNK